MEMYNNPIRTDTPLIYHFDVTAMYPNNKPENAHSENGDSIVNRLLLRYLPCRESDSAEK